MNMCFLCGIVFEGSNLLRGSARCSYSTCLPQWKEQLSRTVPTKTSCFEAAIVACFWSGLLGTQVSPRPVVCTIHTPDVPQACSSGTPCNIGWTYCTHHNWHTNDADHVQFETKSPGCRTIETPFQGFEGALTWEILVNQWSLFEPIGLNRHMTWASQNKSACPRSPGVTF